MQNASDFTYLFLNSGSMYQQSEISETFTRILIDFQRFLTQNSAYKTIATHLESGLLASDTTISDVIGSQIQKLSVGNFRFLMNKESYQKHFIYKFKKASPTSISVLIYSIDVDNNQVITTNTESLFTNINATDNIPGTQYTITLNNETIPEFTRFIHRIHLSNRSTLSDIQKSMAFLQTAITLVPEQYNPQLLQNQPYFVRTMYRLLSDCVADPLVLEKCLFDFVRHHLQQPNTIHAGLWQNGITNHIAYLQYTTCYTAQEKQTIINNLLPQLKTLNATPITFTTPSSNKFRKTSVETHYRDTPLKATPPKVNQLQPFDTPLPLQNIYFLDPTPIEAPLKEAIKFNQALNTYAAQNDYWCLASIEYFITRCPLPLQTNGLKHPAYQTMQIADWQALGTAIESITQHYLRAVKSYLQDKQTPKMWVTLCSIIIFRNDCHQQEQGPYAPHAVIRAVMADLLAKMKLLPHISTYHPDFDARWVTLCSLYKPKKEKRYSLNPDIEDTYTNLLKLSHDYAKIERLVTEENKNKVKNDAKKPLEYYLKSNNTFPDAKSKFAKAVALDNFFADCFDGLRADSRYTCTISYHYGLTTPLDHIQRFALIHQNHLDKSKFITTSKEVCQSNALVAIALRNRCQQALPEDNYSSSSNNPYSSNSIQITAHHGEKTRRMTVEDIHVNQLLQFDLADNPIPLVLNHCFSQINELSTQDMQYYTQENLLRGMAFLSYLAQPELFDPYLKQFDAFVEKGLKHFEDHSQHLTQSSLFFIQLAMQVNTYIAHSKRHDSGNRLKHLLERVNIWLNNHRKNYNISASLHQMRLAIIMTLKQLSASDALPFEQAFLSYGYLKVHCNIEATTSFFATTEQAGIDYQFQYWLQNSFAAQVTPDLIRNLAEQIELPLASTDTIQIEDHNTITIYRSTQILFSFNVSSNVFFNAEGLQYSALPEKIRNHPILPHLNQAPLYCFCNPEHTLIVLSQDACETRIEFSRYKSVRVYQALSLTGTKKPYQLIPLNTSISHAINFEDNTLRLSSNSYFSTNMRCWLSLDASIAYIMQDDRIVYTVTPQEMIYHDPNDAATKYVHYYTKDDDSAAEKNAISMLEEPNYCHIHLNPETLRGKMQLLRYPELQLELESTNLFYAYHGDRYTQVLTGRSPFTPAAKINHLLFQHNGDSEKMLALVTVQKFRSQIYGGQNRYIYQSNTSHANNTALKVITYHCDPHTALLTSTSAYDALYLAYVYMATYDYDKAITTLHSFNLIDLHGNQDEVQILTWIMDLDMGDQRRLYACQLFAFSLYTRCIQEKLSGNLSFKETLLKLLKICTARYDAYIQSLEYLPKAYVLDALAINSLEDCFTAQSVAVRSKESKEKTIANRTFHPSSYLSLPQVFEDNLLHRPHGTRDHADALAHLNSNITEEKLSEYFACYVEMTQSPQYKARILQFCKGYLQLSDYSTMPDMVQVLYRLCHQTIDLSKKTPTRKDTNASQNPDFPYLSPQTTTTTVALPKPSTIVASALTPLQLRPAVETIQAMQQFMQAHYLDFYQAYQNLHSEQTNQMDAVQNEEAIGNVKTHYVAQKLALIRNTFAQSKVRTQLLTKLSSQQTIYANSATTYWKQAVAQANPLLEAQKYYLIQAGYYSLLTEHDLMYCYATANYEHYIQMTLITEPAAIQHLHETIHQAMLATIQAQHFQRLIDEITDSQHRDPATIRWGKLLDLMLRDHEPSLQQRADMVHLEVTKNIMIRPEQAQIANGLKQSPRIIDSVMGSGKTSVVTPMVVSQIPAQTLKIVIVLRALLKTTHNYLHTLGAKVNQIPYLFDFHRNDEHSVQTLQNKHALFNHLVFHNKPVNPHYLVSTAESIQSLGLKYVELVYSSQYIEFAKQITLLQQMLLLVLNHGEVLIDEIHEVQDDYKAPVRYALDKPIPVPQELIQDVIGLYKFRDEYPYDDIADFVGMMLDLENSPIQIRIKQFLKANPQYTEHNIKKAIADYWLYDTAVTFDPLPRFRAYLDTVQTQIRLFEHITHVNHKEHYGPSKLKHLTPLERSLAIPYSFNEKPKHGSRYEEPQENITYTIESCLQEFPYELFLDLIKKWIDQAGGALQNASDQFHTFEDTPAAVRFKSLFEMDLTPLMLKTDRAQLEALWRKAQHNVEILYDILQFDILPLIQIDCTVIESRAFDHILSYRAASGMTASPDATNQSLPVDNSGSRGAREAIATVLIQQQTPVRHLDYTHIDAFLEALYNVYPHPTQLRALLDIGGRLKGETLTIAQGFARLLARKGSPIKYVIYFDDLDELYAIPTQNLDQPRYLGRSTDPKIICSTLQHCDIEDLAIYLDQSHTEGSDFVLAADCHGAAILNKETSFSKMIQGSMRLRELPEGQRITVILPTCMNAITTIEEVIAHCRNQTDIGLPKRTLSTVSGEISGLIRRDIWTKMLELPTVKEQHEFLHRSEVKPFFVKSRKTYLEETEKSDTHLTHGERLQAHATRSLESWRTAVGQTVDTVDHPTVNKVSAVLARPTPYTNLSSSDPLFGGSLETQTQIQIQIVPPDLGVNFDPTLKAKNISLWNSTKPLSLRQLLPENEKIRSYFSDQLFVSHNFIRIHTQQSHDTVIHPYMKPVDIVLFSLDERQHMTACLITVEEACDPTLMTHIQATKNTWLSTTNHLVLQGQAPQNIQEDFSYLTLLEQIRFFAGKFNELVEQKTPYLWLTEDPTGKFDFYEANVKNWRRPDSDNFERLKGNFSRQMLVFTEMMKHPFKNYVAEHFAWEDINPDITPADIHIFQALAEAYLQMNRDYYDYNFAGQTLFDLMQSLKSTLKLPTVVLGYVSQHLKRLSDYKAALLGVVHPRNNHYLMRLATLNGPSLKLINDILGISVQQLLDQYHYDAPTNQFPNAQTQFAFELDALGCFLTSNAFPKGARAAFIQPIQDKLNELDAASQIAALSNSSINEYKLRFLISTLEFKAEALLALAQTVNEPETIIAILKRCKHHPAIIQTSVERFAVEPAVLDKATQSAAQEESFALVVATAEQQSRLFNTAWLSILFGNPHLPTAIGIDLLQKPEANDACLQYAHTNSRVITTLCDTPTVFLAVLNTLSRNANLSSELQQKVIIDWVNTYAKTNSLTGQLSQAFHDFYFILFAEMSNKEADSAIAYLIRDAHTHSSTVWRMLVTAILSLTSTENSVAPVKGDTAKRYILVNGQIYQTLLAHYVEVDTPELLTLLIEHSGNDIHLQQLMDSKHLDAVVVKLVTRTIDLTWLIAHAKTSEGILQRIILDPRFTTTFALAMIKRNLGAETMQRLLQSPHCTADVCIAGLNDPTQAAYHAEIVELLIGKLPFDNAHILTLIQHAHCTQDSQFSRIIPYASQLAQRQALAAKIQTAACAKQLIEHSACDVNITQKITLSLITGEQFDDPLLSKILTSACAQPEFFVTLQTHVLTTHATIGLHTAYTGLNYPQKQSKTYQQILNKLTQSDVHILVHRGLLIPAILAILEQAPLQNPALFQLISKQHGTDQRIGRVLRNKGIQDPTLLSFDYFSKLLADHAFGKEALPNLLETYPVNVKDSSDPDIAKLQMAAKQLHAKSKVFLQPGKDPHNNAAQASAALYFTLRHQLIQYERGGVSRQQLAKNLQAILPKYQEVLSQHRGYRQIFYDIAQAILCLLGIGVAMTAYNYATTGTFRLFIWKNEGQRIAEEVEATLRMIQP